jgi:hypothetical protein
MNPKEEVLNAIRTAKAALDKPLDAMGLHLVKETLAFAEGRMALLTVARPKSVTKAPEAAEP